MSKKIEYIIIHSTATPEGRKVTRQDIYDWHIKGHGWSRLGYSDIIHLDGKLELLTDYDMDSLIENHEMTWGVKGINQISRHIVYVGGLDKNLKPKDTRTESQKETMADYVRFMVKRYPWIKVAGHNKFANKDCPCFDWQTWLREIGIPDKNIG